MSEKPTPYKVGNILTGIFRSRPLILDGEEPVTYGKKTPKPTADKVRIIKKPWKKE